MKILKNIGAVAVVVGFVLWFIVGPPLLGLLLMFVGAIFYFVYRRQLKNETTQPAPSNNTETQSPQEKLEAGRDFISGSKQKLQPRTSQTSDTAQSAMIEAEGLSKFYGEFAASRNVNFKINRGEVVAFLGPNGAGKSTTMKMLTGYLAPSEGTAHIAGYNMSDQRIQGLRHLGYLPENGPLYLDMTPHSLLSFFADARGMSRIRKNERIEAVVELCDLSSVIYKAISKLSKGYRQRLGMAQALLHEPDVLIMDEPTAGLDPNQIHEVRNTMNRLGKDRTILLSTHIMQEVEAMANRVIMIHEGELVYDGAMTDITQNDESLDQAFRRLTTPVEII